jgi:hypothetical protein
MTATKSGFAGISGKARRCDTGKTRAVDGRSLRLHGLTPCFGSVVTGYRRSGETPQHRAAPCPSLRRNADQSREICAPFNAVKEISPRMPPLASRMKVRGGRFTFHPRHMLSKTISGIPHHTTQRASSPKHGGLLTAAWRTKTEGRPLPKPKAARSKTRGSSRYFTAFALAGRVSAGALVWFAPPSAECSLASALVWIFHF